MKTLLLLDRRTLQPQGMCNAALRVCPIQKDEGYNPLFTEEFFAQPPKRWEPRYDNGYPNVIFDPADRRFRCYYTLFLEDPVSAAVPKAERAQQHYRPTPDRCVGLAYAESEDGIHWVKPSLNLVQFEGSTQNNILFRYAHGTGVMLDLHDPDPQRRYKLVTKMDFSDQKGGFMAINFSHDGVHWGEMLPWPEHNPQADSHNFPFFDELAGVYRVMTRCWRDGVRVVTSCESKDFLHWSAPREVLRGCGFERQIYSMPVFMYNELYLGLASVFHEGDRSAANFDTVDCELYCAVTPDVFSAVAAEQSFIPRGKGTYPDGALDCGCVYASPPVRIQNRLYFYYMGGNGRHTDFRETSLARGWLQGDHFAYYTPKDAQRDAILKTAQLQLEETSLLLSAEIEGDGFILASLFDSWNGNTLPGFSEAECTLEPASEGKYLLRFGGSPETLRKRGVCLSLRFRGARLFAIQGQVELQRHRLWEGV